MSLLKEEIFSKENFKFSFIIFCSFSKKAFKIILVFCIFWFQEGFFFKWFNKEPFLGELISFGCFVFFVDEGVVGNLCSYSL